MKIRLPSDRAAATDASSGKNEQSNKGMQQSKRRVEDVPNTPRVIDVRFAADPQCWADSARGDQAGRVNLRETVECCI
jgi:hypothetical protein